MEQRATDFLAARPTSEARGGNLAIQAVTNAVAALPLTTRVLQQLGNSAFEVALAFMDRLSIQRHRSEPDWRDWPGRFAAAVPIWSKLGVTFDARPPVTRTSAALKTANTTNAQQRQIMATQTGAGVEVFMVDNDLPNDGGGVAWTPPRGGPSSQIILADRGTSNTLLAHEIGHALGLEHPGAGTARDGEANTIMAPSGSHSVANPARNTMQNYGRMTGRAGGNVCLRPDP